MIRVLAPVGLVGLVALSASTGCSTVTCGPGTFKDGDNCVAFDPNDKTPPITTIAPVGKRSRDPIPSVATLTTNEPARIYYTTNGADPDPTTDPGQRDLATIVGITQGTTVKFFSIDLAGNREMTQSTTYLTDVTPPAPVTGMTVVLTGSTAHVAWTNPTDPDYTGTVVARVTEIIDGEPAPGGMVAAGSMLTPSLAVLSTDTRTQLDDPVTSVGPVRYVAWTYDDLGNYSAPIAATAEPALGPMTAQLSYNTANSTLTVVQSPAHLVLTGTTAALAGTTLTVTLSVMNATTHYFQNPKAEITSVTGGTFGNSDGTADAFPFRTLGPNMLAPNIPVTTTLVVTGVAAGTTATINLTFASHPSLISTHGRNAGQLGTIDLGSGALVPFLQMTARGPNDRPGGRAHGAIVTGGHYLDVASSHGSIERFDLATRKHVGSVNLVAGDQANIQSLTSTGGDMIAVIKYGGQRHQGALELVRVDEGLHATTRETLTFNDEAGFSRPALSPDGSTLALPVSGGILLVATATLAPIDADPTTPAIDLFDPGISGRLGSVAFFNGSNGLVVLAKKTGQVSVIKRTPTGYTTALVYDDTTKTRSGFLATTGPDGRIWMAFASGIRAYDPVTDTVAPVTYASVPNGLSLVGGQMWIIHDDKVTLDQVSSTGAVLRTVSVGPAANSYTIGVFGHWLDVAP